MIYKRLKHILLIALGVFLISASIQWFLAPHNIAAGGASGLGIILENLLGISISNVVFLMNIVVLTLAFIFLSFDIFTSALIGSALLPLMLDIIPPTPLVQDTFFSVIIGSILFGIGVYILFNNNASSGGTTIPPLILKKRFNIDPAKSLMMIDAVIVALSFFVFGAESFFFAIFSIVITMMTMNALKARKEQGHSLLIISQEHHKVVDYVQNTLGRGVTLIRGEGTFTKTQTPILLVAIKGNEYDSLVRNVHEIDETAFIISQNTRNIYGSGFSYTRTA